MRRLLTLCGLLLAARIAVAELPQVRFDRIQPLGAAAGSTVEVEFLGAEVDEITELRFDRPGFQATKLTEKGKERRFSLAIAADVPEGTYDVRLVGRFGVSNPRIFAVSRDLADVAEKEPNNAADTAQPLELNVAVNGSSDQNDQDVFRLKLAKGKRVVIDCQAGRLLSTLDANLALATAEGKSLVSNGDYFGRDSLLDFVAPADGEYLLTLNDLSFRGGHPYRLVVTDRPQVENVFPRAIELGKAAEVTVLGRNLPGGKPSAKSLFDLPLEEATLSITAPSDAAAIGRYDFLEHPVANSVQPTAATCTLSGFQIRPDCGGKQALNAVALVLSETPVTLEAEPNDVREQPQPLALPATISGRFDQPRDADWFTFDGGEGGNIYVDVYCERIAGQADPFVVLFDDKDQRVAELDDFGHRVNAFDGHLRDPNGQFSVQKGKQYKLLVQDRYQRGGPRYQYVLSVRRPRPDFFAAAMHSANPGPAGTTLRKGGSAYLDVVVHHRDGLGEALTLTAEGLPAGVHLEPTHLAPNQNGVCVLWADDNAADWVGPLKLFATTKRGDETIRREVTAFSRVANDNNIGGSMPARSLVVSVGENAPYTLQLAPNRLTVEAGKKLEVKAQLTRHWPEFKEKLTCLPLSFPNAFKLANTEIAAGANEATLSIDVQANAKPGDYTLSVLGQAQVPYHKSPDEKNRPNTLVSLPSRPVTIKVTAPPK